MLNQESNKEVDIRAREFILNIETEWFNALKNVRSKYRSWRRCKYVFVVSGCVTDASTLIMESMKQVILFVRVHIVVMSLLNSI